MSSSPLLPGLISSTIPLNFLPLPILHLILILCQFFSSLIFSSLGVNLFPFVSHLAPNLLLGSHGRHRETDLSKTNSSG